MHGPSLNQVRSAVFVAQALPQTISVATSFSVAGLPYDSIQVNVVLPAFVPASA